MDRITNVFLVIVFIFVGVTLWLSHSSFNNRWTANSVLPAGYEISDLTFIDESEGFIFGSYKSDELRYKRGFNDALREQEAIIFKTTDGGLSWKKVYEGMGKIVKACYRSDIIYAIRTSYDSEDNKSSHLLKSDDIGQNWIEIRDMPILIYGIGFYNHMNGVVWGFEKNDKCNNNYIVLSSSDGGINWKPVRFSYIPNAVYGEPIVDNKGNFIYFSSEKLVIKDIKTGDEKVEKIPDKFEPAILSLDQKHHLWVIGTTEKRLRLFKKDAEKKFTEIPLKFTEKSFSPISLYVYNNIITIFVQEIKASQFLPIYHLYRSDNSGTEWIKEELPVTSKAEPVAFYGTDNIWAMGPGGVMQRRRK